MSNQQIPDVRVQLSAEGVADVVRAFQQVSAAAKKSGAESTAGFLSLKGALGELKGLLPTLGFAGAVTGLGAMVKGALDTADSMGKLSQKTGLSTETLSTLNFAAGTADLSFESLSKGLIKFNKTNGDLEGGTKKAALAVKELFGSETALSGLNTDQRFAKVATAIGKLPAGFQKTTDAMNFMGKSGAEFIPLFDEIATKGLPAVEREATKFGQIVTAQMAAAATKAKDSLILLKQEAQGLALQFTAGLAPSITQVATAITGITSTDDKSGLQRIGEDVGVVVRNMAGILIAAGVVIKGAAQQIILSWEDAKDVISTGMKETLITAKSTGSQLAKLLSGDTEGAGIQFVVGAAQIDAMDKAQAARTQTRAAQFAKIQADGEKTIADLKAALSAPPGDTPPKVTQDANTQQDAVNLAREHIALLTQRLQNELALYKQYDALNTALETADYQAGITSLTDYFDARAAAIKAAGQKELTELEAERALLLSSPLDLQAGASQDKVQAAALVRRKAIEAVDAKIAQARVTNSAAEFANDTARSQAEQALAQKTIEIQGQIKTAQGDTYGAAIDAINAQADALEKLHLPAELIAQFKQISVADAQLKELQREGQNTISALGVAQAQIQNQTDAGALFPFQAVQRYDAAIVEALPRLRALAAAQLAAAVTPEQVINAEQFANQVEQLGLSADESAKRMAQFKASVESSLTSDLTTFFTSGIDQARNFGDAVRSMAASVVNSLRQIAAQMLATLIVQRMLSAFQTTSAIGTGLQIAGEVAGGAVVAATGGYVSGPGGPVSDSIPARLSAGEFVVRAASVSQPGILPLLAAINRGMGTPSMRTRSLPRFAAGGVVGMSQGSPSDAPSSSLTVGLEDGLVLKHMNSTDGRRVILRQIAANPKQFKAALGLR